ncbi:MAG: IS1 family transposase [Waterburya sp.]
MQCPKCESNKIVKNGWRQNKQNYLCRNCGRQFISTYDQRGYSQAVKEHCLTLYCNGMGFRGIERSTGVCHNTVINWVQEASSQIPDENYEIPQRGDGGQLEFNSSFRAPETAQLDELQTFVGSKKTIWLWTAVNSHQVGLLKWVIGDRSQTTFSKLWWIIRGWECFLYITDGWKVYPCFINDCDHLVSKTGMTRVEGENSRLRHYLARLHRKTFCYSKSIEMLEASVRLLTYYLKH